MTLARVLCTARVTSTGGSLGNTEPATRVNGTHLDLTSRPRHEPAG